MSRNTTIALALALAAVLAFVAIEFCARRGAPDARELERAARGAQGAQALAPAELASGLENPAESSARAEPAAEREAREPSRAAPSGELLEVLLHERGSRAAVPGAELFALELDAAQPIPDTALEWIERQLAGRASVRADARGRAQLARPPGACMLVARSAGLFGARRWDPASQGPCELLLGPDAELRVQVLDPRGMPVEGARVQIYGRRERGSWHRETITTAGAQGLARFPHLPAWAQAAEAARVTVKLDVIADAPIERELALDPVPSEPVLLVMPLTGSVRVELAEHDGRPLIGSALVWLRAERVGDALRGQPMWTIARGDQRAAREGSALFENVSLGLPLTAWAVRHGSRSGARVLAPGPLRVGEATVLPLRFGTETLSLALRVLDAAGQPVPERVLAITQLASGGGESWDPTTDAQGRACIDVLGLPDGHEELVFQLQLGELQARFRVPPGPGTGILDVGDLRLEAGALLVAGHVRDELGQPCAGVRVQIGVADPRWGEGYRDIEGLECTSDEDGSFALRGSVPATRLQLHASASGLWIAPLELPVGSSGIELFAERAGALGGELALPPGIDTELVFLRIQRQPPEQEWNWQSVRVERDGSFRAASLRAGTYSLVVRPRSGGERELARLDGLCVPPGADSTDARLHPLAIERALHALALRVLDTAGNMLNGIQIRWRSARQPEADWSRAFGGEGLVRLICTELPIEAIVKAEGYRSEHLASLSADTEVRLRAGLRVRLVLDDASALPKPPFSIAAMLQAEEADDELITDSPCFDERGEARHVLSRPGRYRLSWAGQRHDESSITMTTVGEQGPPQILEVIESDAEQVFAVHADAAAWAAAVAALPH